MKGAVWQKEDVYQNSFFGCMTRDDAHGYLKTDAGTHQAPAEDYGGLVRHDLYRCADDSDCSAQ